MNITEKEIGEIVDALRRLTPTQLQWIKATILALGVPHKFWRASDSDIVTQAVLDNLGDRLLIHHMGSRQALSKDRFEFAFEASLVNRHVKLTRILGKSALKSFHPELLNYRHFAGELWSDRDGYNCRNQKASFCQ